MTSYLRVMLPALLLLPVFRLAAATVSCEFAVPAMSDQENAKTRQRVLITELTKAPQIDGHIDNDIWNRDKSISDFVWLRREGQRIRQAVANQDIKEQARIKVTEQTRVFCGYDATAVYFAFVCDESQMRKLKTIEKTGSAFLWEDDCVELLFSPDPGQPQKFYHFIINAHGNYSITQVDGKNRVMRNQLPVTVAATVEPKGWTVELRIPFKEFGLTPPRYGTCWLINFCREQQPGKEISSWSETRIAFSEPENFGLATFGRPSSWETETVDWGEMLPGDNTVKVQLKNNTSTTQQINLTLALDRKNVAEKNLSLPGNRSIIAELPYRILPGTGLRSLIFSAGTTDNAIAETREQTFSVPGKLLECRAKQSEVFNSSSTVKVDFLHNLAARALPQYRLRLTWNDVAIGGDIALSRVGGTLTITPDYMKEGVNLLKIELLDQQRNVQTETIRINGLSDPFRQ